MSNKQHMCHIRNYQNDLIVTIREIDPRLATGWYPIEDLERQLAIDGVIQQIKDKPLSKRIKQPRYKDSDGEDWIDQSYKDLSWQEFCGAMKFTIGKYMRRLGRKDAEVSELEKVADYAERWAEKARQRINEEV